MEGQSSTSGHVGTEYSYDQHTMSISRAPGILLLDYSHQVAFERNSVSKIYNIHDPELVSNKYSLCY